MTEVMTQGPDGEGPAANLFIRFDQQPSSRSVAGMVAATARLDVLRPAIEPILQESGVPIELAAVALVESGARTGALSSKGALGLWQLMPATARRYGLRVDNMTDDRLDIGKSTWAASRYLSDLHLQFGSWPLALAAYNTGEHNVQRAISRSRSTDFTVLNSLGMLPFETRTYVPRVIAVMQSLGHPVDLEVYRSAAHGTTVFTLSKH